MILMGFLLWLGGQVFFGEGFAEEVREGLSAVWVFAELQFGCDGAVGGVVDYVGDGVYGSCVGVGFGEVVACGLEGVEEESGTFGVEGVLGELLDDFADGVLDGAAVFGAWEGEGGSASFALGGVGDGCSGGVVVEAEGFVGEAGAAAAVSVGEQVTA